MGNSPVNCPTPILYLIFNRPDLQERSFASIQAARPSQLFIAADGPRAEKGGEAALCQQARAIVDQVDWPCQVQTLFRDENLGCRRAVSSAIDWFFQHVEEGIILEDDCVADSTFFRFCDELLDCYRNDLRVMSITGNNFQNGSQRGKSAYYFSYHFHCWGWATWRRAWRLYDRDLTTLNDVEDSGYLHALLGEAGGKYWLEKLSDVKSGRINTWDTIFLYSCWINHGLTVTPNVNLVTNIGFDERATHTKSGDAHAMSSIGNHLKFPLDHPNHVRRDIAADTFVQQTQFQKPNLKFRIWRGTSRFLGLDRTT